MTLVIGIVMAALAVLIVAGASMAATGPGLRDALLTRTLALPNGAATTVSASIDLGPIGQLGSRSSPGEWIVEAPALNTSQLPDAKTMTYDVILSDNADLSAPTVYSANCLIQTGAGGAGAAAATYRFRLPSDSKRYLGFRATGSDAGDASGAVATLAALL